MNYGSARKRSRDQIRYNNWLDSRTTFDDPIGPAAVHVAQGSENLAEDLASDEPDSASRLERPEFHETTVESSAYLDQGHPVRRNVVKSTNPTQQPPIDYVSFVESGSILANTLYCSGSVNPPFNHRQDPASYYRGGASDLNADSSDTWRTVRMQIPPLAPSQSASQSQPPGSKTKHSKIRSKIHSTQKDRDSLLAKPHVDSSASQTSQLEPRTAEETEQHTFRSSNGERTNSEASSTAKSPSQLNTPPSRNSSQSFEPDHKTPDAEASQYPATPPANTAQKSPGGIEEGFEPTDPDPQPLTTPPSTESNPVSKVKDQNELFITIEEDEGEKDDELELFVEKNTSEGPHTPDTLVVPELDLSKVPTGKDSSPSSTRSSIFGPETTRETSRSKHTTSYGDQSENPDEPPPTTRLEYMPTQTSKSDSDSPLETSRSEDTTSYDAPGKKSQKVGKGDSTPSPPPEPEKASRNPKVGKPKFKLLELPNSDEPSSTPPLTQREVFSDTSSTRPGTARNTEVDSVAPVAPRSANTNPAAPDEQESESAQEPPSSPDESTQSPRSPSYPDMPSKQEQRRLDEVAPTPGSFDLKSSTSHSSFSPELSDFDKEFYDRMDGHCANEQYSIKATDISAESTADPEKTTVDDTSNSGFRGIKYYTNGEQCSIGLTPNTKRSITVRGIPKNNEPIAGLATLLKKPKVTIAHPLTTEYDLERVKAFVLQVMNLAKEPAPKIILKKVEGLNTHHLEDLLQFIKEESARINASKAVKERQDTTVVAPAPTSSLSRGALNRTTDTGPSLSPRQ